MVYNNILISQKFSAIYVVMINFNKLIIFFSRFFAADLRPCLFEGCYTKEEKCDGIKQCLDGVDERDCFDQSEILLEEMKVSTYYYFYVKSIGFFFGNFEI